MQLELQISYEIQLYIPILTRILTIENNMFPAPNDQVQNGLQFLFAHLYYILLDNSSGRKMFVHHLVNLTIVYKGSSI